MKVAKKINTILCDDVRSEVGNKFSLIGIYSKDIVFNEIPALYPKLCIVIFLEELKELFHDVKVVLKTPESDDVVIKMKTPSEASLKGNLVLTFALSPFRIKAIGKARFSVYFGDAKRPSITHDFGIKLAKKN